MIIIISKNPLIEYNEEEEEFYVYEELKQEQRKQLLASCFGDN